MKFGLIELHLDVNGTGSNAGLVCLDAIQSNPADREQNVRLAVQRARISGCDFILAPGWTLRKGEPPDWLLESSTACTIVAECLSRSGVTGVYVMHAGQIVLGPVRQRIGEAKELTKKGSSSGDADALMHELRAGSRRWAVPGIGDAILYICGEVNIVGSCEHRVRKVAADAGVTERSLLASLVVNPSHTASPLPAMRDKRAWLSQRGLLIHTANTYSSGWTKKRQADLPGKASITAAKAWSRGRPLNLVMEGCHQPALGNGYVLKTFVWEPENLV
jgi:hypothetical protein